MEQKFRHEYKHSISPVDAAALRMRLPKVMQKDSFSVGGKYGIRSLYFDNLFDKALFEKINGVSCREKFRIRYYNGDTSFIRLEKKSKLGGLNSKQSAPLICLRMGLPFVTAETSLLTSLRSKWTRSF